MAVMRVLTNEIYVGTLIQGKESTPNYKVKVQGKRSHGKNGSGLKMHMRQS